MRSLVALGIAFVVLGAAGRAFASGHDDDVCLVAQALGPELIDLPEADQQLVAEVLALCEPLAPGARLAPVPLIQVAAARLKLVQIGLRRGRSGSVPLPGSDACDGAEDAAPSAPSTQTPVDRDPIAGFEPRSFLAPHGARRPFLPRDERDECAGHARRVERPPEA